MRCRRRAPGRAGGIQRLVAKLKHFVHIIHRVPHLHQPRRHTFELMSFASAARRSFTSSSVRNAKLGLEGLASKVRSIVAAVAEPMSSSIALYL